MGCLGTAGRGPRNLRLNIRLRELQGRGGRSISGHSGPDDRFHSRAHDYFCSGYCCGIARTVYFDIDRDPGAGCGKGNSHSRRLAVIR